MSNNNKKYIPTNDYVFKRIFGKEGNEDITKDFIKCATGIEYENINLNSKPILEADIINNKMGVLDVRVEGDENSKIDIEMQVTANEYMADRILWYWAKLYSETMKKGNTYDNTKRAICILIVDFEIDKLKNVPEYNTVWNIRERTHKEIILTDKLEIVIIELRKLDRNKNTENKRLLDWCKFIKAPEEVSEKIMKENENIRKAKEELDKINNDEHERMLAELREKAIMDELAIRKTGYNEGKREGLKQGLQEGKKEGIIEGEKNEKINIAQNMIKKKLDKNMISEVTGLTIEEIEKLSK